MAIPRPISLKRSAPFSSAAMNLTSMSPWHRAAEAWCRKVLARAGVEVDGPQPWDFQVRDPSVFARIAMNPTLEFGETYVDGLWDCARVDELVHRLLRVDNHEGASRYRRIAGALMGRWVNFQSRARARDVCDAHYDLDVRLYEKMLDRRMTYTCGYWSDGAKDLDQAQEAKLEMICRKIELRPGMRVLDIGCGFGSFMKYAAERHGAICVGYSISRSQIELGRRLCAGFPVEFIEKDYRDIAGRFDRIVSIGMFEAVGPKNFRTFMEVAHRALADDGIFLLHTMGSNVAKTDTQPWLHRHIFPNGIVPSAGQIGEAIEGLLTLEDWHGFGQDYDRTLMAWHENFTRAFPELQSLEPALFTDRFRRIWDFYLLSFAASFRARNNHLWQIVMTKGTRPPPARWRGP